MRYCLFVVYCLLLSSPQNNTVNRGVIGVNEIIDTDTNPDATFASVARKKTVAELEESKKKQGKKDSRILLDTPKVSLAW